MERKNIVQLLHDCRKKYTHKHAIIDHDTSYTYQQIDEYSNAVATFLCKHSFKSATRVLISLENSAKFVIIYWGVIKASCSAVLVNPSCDNDVLLNVLSKASPGVIFCESTSILMTVSETGNLQWPVCAQICCRFIQDETSTRYNLDEIFSGPTSTCSSSLSGSDIATIIYTSGSSGVPKGVVLSHNNMLAAVQSIADYLPYRHDDRLLCCIPLTFDYGLYQMLLIFYQGGQLILTGDFFLPHRLFKLIATHQITLFPMLPKMVELLFDFNRISEIDLTSVKLLSFTGEKLRAHHVEKVNQLFPRATIYSMYGLTECKRCTFIPPHRLIEKINSVGIAIPNTQLWIEDEKGQLLPAGRRGELVIQSPRIMQEYWHDPIQTINKLKFSRVNKSICLYSGDYCSLDEEGYVYHHGRMDDRIIDENKILCLTDLENELYNCVSLKEVHLLQQKTIDQVYIDCFVVLKPEAPAVENIQNIRDLFAQHKLEYKLHLVDVLPRTLNGKVDRKKLVRQTQQLDDANVSAHEGVPCCQ